MSASTKAMTSSSSAYRTPAFWERLWRINFVVFFVVAYVIYGSQPHVGASTDALTAFYVGDRTRILIAAVFSGLTVLNLLWFAAALRTTLADAGQDGWGAAATASSASGRESRIPPGSKPPAPEARNKLAQRFSAGYVGQESNSGGMT